MKITIIGAGAIGTMLAVLLANKENKISLILRKEQLLLGESGLDITKEILTPHS